MGGKENEKDNKVVQKDKQVVKGRHRLLYKLQGGLNEYTIDSYFVLDYSFAY